MKKIISVLVVAAMLLTGMMAITASAAEGAVFTVDAVKDGNQLDVTINLTSDMPFAIAYLSMYYNTEALVVDEDSITSYWEVGRKDTADLYLEEEGWLFFEIVADDMEGAGIAAPQGKAYTLSFEIIDETADFGFIIKPHADDEFNSVAAPLIEIEDAVALPVTCIINDVTEVTTAPVTTAPAPVETPAPVADETTAPVADETTAPVADETTAPDAADETTAPSASETTKPASKPSSPQTGDSMVFVAVIAVLALAACSTVVVVRSKKASK